MSSLRSEPLVSVIIPTYNRPAYLRDAIASVLHQTYPHLEIIVSDDGSRENPQAIVESFHDPRIRFRRNATNLGIGLNATYAFQMAQGKYVASLNDDDLWHPDFLATLVPPLEANPDLVLSFCDHYIIDADGTINQPATEASTQRWHRHQLTAGEYRPFIQLGLVDQAVYAASAAVIRKQAVDWPQLHEAGVFWDYYLVYLACRSGQGAYYCPDRLSLYRVHPQSETTLSGNRDIQAKIRKGKAAIFCHNRFQADPNLREFHSYFQRQWAYASTTLGIGLLRANQPLAARSYFLKALQVQKFDGRAIAGLLLSLIPPLLAQPLSRVSNPSPLSKL